MKKDYQTNLRGTDYFPAILRGATCLFLVLGFTAVATASRPQSYAETPPISPSRTPILSRTGTPTFQRINKPTNTATPTYSSPSRLSISPAQPLLIPGQPQVDANTVVLYHFDSPSGSNAIDATGNYTGTLYGTSIVNTTGLYAGVLQLDGLGSYVRTGNVGSFPSGTIEAFVDFQSGCYGISGYPFAIFSAGGEYGSSQQPVLWLGNEGFLRFKIFANNKLYMADSTINPCRYLDGNGSKDIYFSYLGLPAMWPYETWRFHHVAGTWGPRGIEIWVDGVLHGVGLYVPDPSNPPDHYGYSCSPQQQETSTSYPNCDVPSMGLVPGSYGGGLPPYDTFLIGCDPYNVCFKGRIDEVRISDIQRTFSYTVDPTVTPTPTQTPDRVMAEYAVDANTLALYHLNFQASGNGVLNEVSGQYSWLAGNAVIVSGGHSNSALSLDGNNSYFSTPNIGNPRYGAVEAWVKLTNSNGNFNFISAGDGFAAKLHLGVLSYLASTLRFGISDSTGAHWADSRVNPSALLGSWHFVAGTWGSRGLEIWVDGNLCGTNPSFTGKMSDSVDNFLVGCQINGNCMQGLIDEVRISNIQRSFSTLGPSSSNLPALRNPRFSANSTPTIFWNYLPFIWSVPISPPLC